MLYLKLSCLLSDINKATTPTTAHDMSLICFIEASSIKNVLIYMKYRAIKLLLQQFYVICRLIATRF